MRKLILIACAFLFCAGSCNQRKYDGARAGVDRNAEALKEEARAVITGAADALAVAPTNAPVNLAKTFVGRAQQIEGLPLVRYDVDSILGGARDAISDMSARIGRIDRLLAQRDDLERKLSEAQARLAEMGRLYEAEKNRNIVKRVWRWAVATFGVGGVIALMVFFPFLIPIFTRIVGWIVSMFPKLAGFFGVVLTKSFDSVVRGVQKAKVKIDENKNKPPAATPTPVEVIGDELSKSTDDSHKELIDARKEVLADKGEIPPLTP